MDIQTAPHVFAESVQHVRLTGEPDGNDVPRLSETLQFLIRRVSPRILVDLRHVPPPDKGILTLLQGMAEQARAHGGGLALCAGADLTTPQDPEGGIPPIHGDEAGALAALGVSAFVADAEPGDTTLDIPPHAVGEGGEPRRGLRQTLSMEFSDASSRFSRARTTCVVAVPPREEGRHGVRTEALGRTVVLPRMLPRSGGHPEPLPRVVLAPGFEPVRLWVPARGSYGACLLRTLEVLRDLMGMEAARAARLAAAVEAVFDVACRECPPSDSIGMEYAWKGRILCATMIVPRTPFALYEHLRPATAPEVRDASAARRWMELLLGFVEIKTEGADTHLLLAPLDTTDESVLLPPPSG